MDLYDNRSASVKAVAYLFIALAWFTFPLRIWVRGKMLKSLGIDDILTTITLAIFTVFIAWVLYAAEYGTGRHNASLMPEELVKALKGWWYAETFYILSCFFLKIAFGSFLLRVAKEKLHRGVIWVLIATNIVFYVFYFFQSIFQCYPIDQYWNRVSPISKGSCHNPNFTADSTYAQSALSIVTDFTYATLPIFIVRKLHMTRYKRISLSFVLGLGAIASIAVIIRIPYVVTLATSEDFLWQTTDVVIWSCVEPGLGITILNLAVIRPLLRMVSSQFEDITSSAKSRKQGYTSGVSNYRKASTYGTSTTITNNDNPRCSDVKCTCSCHDPCFYGKDVQQADIEHDLALTPVSPKAAHMKTDDAGIRRTTEIFSSSEPRTDDKYLQDSPNTKYGIAEGEGDKTCLVKPMIGRESYQGIHESVLRRAI
ncbi:uncharacterized protein PV09_09579 [Verruconis gallopava]|uniref:Rhodopsin domain-containing protein n=1 Tax=Verruconis gallopava TaxID=253628 RepID=A0A0D1ZVY8_9PEZI|nr:uncharacterized protein PV09_09579 [Verruconis gallopava]KIV98632.1 hypothetical protein PV09_09579 [Verruconis gallopava]